MENNKKHLYWVIGFILITIIFCGTLIWLNYHSWTFRLEMDENTLEAVKSINLSSIYDKSLECNYPLDCPESINNIPSRNCIYTVSCGNFATFATVGGSN